MPDSKEKVAKDNGSHNNLEAVSENGLEQKGRAKLGEVLTNEDDKEGLSSKVGPLGIVLRVNVSRPSVFLFD